MPRVVERENRITTVRAHAESRPVAPERTVFVAVVHAVDDVRFMALAGSRRELIARLAEYVQRWGAFALHEGHARHLQGLLARGELEAAVELYFGLVGERWDKEWLVTAVVLTDGCPDAVAVLGGVASRDTPCDDHELRAAS